MDVNKKTFKRPNKITNKELIKMEEKKDEY